MANHGSKDYRADKDIESVLSDQKFFCNDTRDSLIRD